MRRSSTTSPASVPRCSLTVKGADVPLDHDRRYDNPWALANFGAPSITIADTDGTLTLDFVHGTRIATVTDHWPGHDHRP